MSASNVVFIYIKNVFDPSDRAIREVSHDPQRAIGDYIPSWVKSPLVTRENGIVVEQDRLDDTYPLPNETIIFCDIPLSGDNSGKSLLRVAAFAAMSYYTGGVAGKFAAGNKLAQGFMQAGMMVAGSYIINSVLPPPVAKVESIEDSNSYGIDGAKNTSYEGLPVPMCYGKFRTAGNIVGITVENETSKQQIVHLLINAGEGPIAGISNLRIDDQPIENYDDWAWAAKYSRDAIVDPYNWDEINTSSEGFESITPGTEDAKLYAPKNIGSFHTVNKGSTLSTDPIEHETTKTVNAIRVDLVAPSGLYRVAESDIIQAYVDVALEVKKRSDSEYKRVKIDICKLNNSAHVYVYDYAYGYKGIAYSAAGEMKTVPEQLANDNVVWNGNSGVIKRTLPGYNEPGENGQYIEERIIDAGVAYRNEFYTETARLYGGSRNALRYSLMTQALEEDYYDLRIWRLTEEADDTSTDTVDSITLSDINEIESEHVGFKGTAMLAVKVRLSDQLTSLPNVTYVNHGRKIKVWEGSIGDGNWNEEAASTNPAWITWDMLTNRVAVDQDESRLNFNAWYRWAKFCEDSDLHFNGIFDTNSNAWDSTQTVARIGRAQLVPTGTKYTVAIERPDAYTMTFGNGNIIEGTLQTNWLTMDERANEVEVTFNDADDEYRQNTVKVASDTYVNGEKQRLSSISLIGVTSAEQALREAWLHINMNKYIRQSASFETTLESVGILPGNVIRIQSDHPLWGFSGRIQSGSTQTVINLDEEVQFESGQQYSLVVHMSHKSFATGSVTNKASGLLKISSGDSFVYEEGLRAFFAGKDRAVYNIDPQGNGSYWIAVDDADLASIGESVTIVKTDVFEQRNISTGQGTHTSVTLESPLSQAPELHANWMIGKLNREGKPFRVTSIEMGSNSIQRKINCLEYDTNAYEDSETTAQPMTYSHLPTYIEQVKSLAVGDRYKRTEFTSDVIVTLQWNQPDYGLYDGADIYGSANGGDLIKIGSVSAGGTSFEHTSPFVGDFWTYKVVAIDNAGRRAAFSSSPIISIYLDGVDSEITTMDVSISTPVANTIKLKWGDLDNQAYVEVYRGTTDVFEDAKRIDKGRGAGYADYVEAGTTYYYWVKFGDNTGSVFQDEVGPVSATAFGYSDIDVDWDDITGEGFDANQRMNDATIPSGIHVGGFGDVVFRASGLRILFEGETLYHPDGNKRINQQAGVVSEVEVPWYGSIKQNPFFLMWTDSAAHSRWQAWDYGTNSSYPQQYNVVPVIYDQRSDIWRAVDATGTQFFFTPVTTDCIIGRGFKVSDSGGLDSVTSFIAANGALPEDYATNSKTFAQPSPPIPGTGADVIKEGDFWIDTDDDNALYRWHEDGYWVQYRDGKITQALDEIAALNESVTAYYQDTPPLNAIDGTLWFDTSDGNKPYIYENGQWVSAQDSGIAQAISDAATAQAIADGKVKLWATETRPTTADGVEYGDLWYDEDTKELLSFESLPDNWIVVSTKGSTWDDVTGEGKPLSYVSHTGENIIADHDFTRALAGEYAWTYFNGQHPPFSKDARSDITFGPYGENSSTGARFSVPSQSWSGIVTKELIPCGPNRRYRFNQRVRTVGTNNGSFRAEFTFYDKNNSFVDAVYGNQISSNPEWKWSTSIVETPNNSEIVSMSVAFIRTGTSGTVYVSECGLVRQYLAFYKNAFAGPQNYAYAFSTGGQTGDVFTDSAIIDQQDISIDKGKEITLSAVTELVNSGSVSPYVNITASFYNSSNESGTKKTIRLFDRQYGDTGAGDSYNGILTNTEKKYLSNNKRIVSEYEYDRLEVAIVMEKEVQSTTSGNITVTDFSLIISAGDQVEDVDV